MRRVIVRQSTANNLEFCPAREGYKTHPDWKELVSEPAVFGTLQHSLIERRLHGETVEEILYSNIQQHVDDVVNACFLDAGQTTDGKMADGLLAETIRAFTAWTKTTAKLDFTPLLIEETLEATVLETDDYQVVLRGTPDLFTQCPTGYDWKTSGRAWKEGKAANSIQAPLYVWLVEQKYGVRARQFTFVVYNRAKGEWTLQDTYPSDGFIESALARVGEYGRMIAAGVYPATPLTYAYGKPSRGWYCSEKWCGAWDFCKYKNLAD